ncbi:MAG: hypothetical protein ACREE7_11290, partial [Dongiaceae bacterium]
MLMQARHRVRHARCWRAVTIIAGVVVLAALLLVASTLPGRPSLIGVAVADDDGGDSGDRGGSSGHGGDDGGGSDDGSADNSGSGSANSGSGDDGDNDTDDDDPAKARSADTQHSESGSDFVPGEVVVANLDAAAEPRIRRLGFVILERQRLASLDLSITRLRVPRTLDAPAART